MEAQVLASIIEATGMIMSAIISISGIFMIMKHRRKVHRLADQVIAYHQYEENLARHEFRKERGNDGTDGQIRHKKGSLRNEYAGDIRPEMTAKEAKFLKESFF